MINMLDTIRLRVHACNHQKKSLIEKTISENTNQSLMLSTANNAFYLKLLSVQGKGFDSQKIYSSEKYVFSDEPFENIISKHTSRDLNAHYVAMNKIRFISEDQVKETNLSIKGRYKLDSSQTNVSYMINPNKGFIDFEFSIPKYIYGHNIAQFVPQYNSSTYIKHVQFMKKREIQLSLLYDRLNRFLKLFFTDLCINFKLEEMIDFHYVEIRRIDLCYNQYFETKEDALMYLEHQKKLALKSTLYNPDTNADFKTTLAYKTQNGNYFKIYHKGTEYSNQKNGDLKKHEIINKRFIDQYQKTVVNDTVGGSNKLTKDRRSELHNDLFAEPTLNDISIKSFLKSDIKKHNRKPYHKLTLKQKKFSMDLAFQKMISIAKNKEFTLSPDEVKLIRPDYTKLKKQLPYDVVFFKDEADKILRYEMSISGKCASSNYKRYCFRRNDTIHKNAKKIYKRVKALDSRKFDLELHKKNPISKRDRKIYNHYQKWISRVTAIVLSPKNTIHNHCISSVNDYDSEKDEYIISQPYQYYAYGSDLEEYDIGTFSDAYLKQIFKVFFETVDRFQLKQLEPYDNLEKRVRRFNADVEKRKKEFRKHSKITDLKESEKINKGLKSVIYSNIIQMYKLMHIDKMSVHQIKTELMLSSSQYFRRLKNLKLLGLSEQHVAMTKKYSTKTDFSTYYFKTSGMNYSNKFFRSQKHTYEN